MDTWIECVVVPGQFSGEYAVQIDTYDGKSLILFARDDEVELEGPVGGSGPKRARLAASIVDRSGDLLLVRLPRQTLENGQYVTLKESQIQQEAKAG